MSSAGGGTRAGAVFGFGGPVVLVDQLDDHTTGQGVHVALIAGDQELAEPLRASRL